MAERLKAAVLKTARGRKVSRGFESLSLRQANGLQGLIITNRGGKEG